MKDALSQVLQNIAEDVLTLICLTMDKEGIDKKYFQDDFSYTVEAANNAVISFLFDGYLSYLDDAKSVFAKAVPTLSELRDWALKKGIPTDNETLQTISKVINSINMAPLNIFAAMEDELDDIFERNWADTIFESIVKKIEYTFHD